MAMLPRMSKTSASTALALASQLDADSTVCVVENGVGTTMDLPQFIEYVNKLHGTESAAPSWMAGVIVESVERFEKAKAEKAKIDAARVVKKMKKIEQAKPDKQWWRKFDKRTVPNRVATKGKR